MIWTVAKPDSLTVRFRSSVELAESVAPLAHTSAGRLACARDSGTIGQSQPQHDLAPGVALFEDAVGELNVIERKHLGDRNFQLSCRDTPWRNHNAATPDAPTEHRPPLRFWGRPATRYVEEFGA